MWLLENFKSQKWLAWTSAELKTMCFVSAIFSTYLWLPFWLRLSCLVSTTPCRLPPCHFLLTPSPLLAGKIFLSQRVILMLKTESSFCLIFLGITLRLLRKLYLILVPQIEFVEKILEHLGVGNKYYFSSPSKIFGEDNGASREKWGEDSKDWALENEAGMRARWATWGSRFNGFLFLWMWLRRLVNGFWCLPMSLVQLQAENAPVTGQLTPVWL